MVQQHALKKKVWCYWEHPWGNALRTWGTLLGTSTRGFQIVMYRGALGCFEKG
jgi:hypothetical protein